ncbi:unnamed protein product [Didymodactylos carnosus]|uniref:Adenylate kinase n=1 Tax=Didymodactylos carnosus TaxID=1234261 RepID=A0A813T2T8_9BILA|nr:unnamed protein product [Didymodactylos carnosus]CAF1066541.1 unnamed protein product [Didymodactylos carnosus]CAF3589832.1 unnamed protein product [Didymodactylos carnosus]CAF3831484.1 unnamed protein product [Didymodactylos carnosus]
MDQSKRPVTISPEFLLYAEKHSLFELFQRCISSLLVERPSDPITYLVDLLKKDTDAPKIVIIGPPSSGRKTLAKLLCKKLNTILIQPEDLLSEAPSKLKDKLPRDPSLENVSATLWAQLYDERLRDFDCIRRGWVIVGFPTTREQTLALQAKGVCPKHVVCLEAPDNVMVERAAGKRVDPRTKEIYHITWNAPSRDVEERLVFPEESSEKAMHMRLKDYRRNIDGIKDCFKSVSRTINADQPMNDLLSQAYSFVSKKARSVAPRTPRVAILGPTGSGRKSVAAQISRKYDIPIVSIPTLIKQQVVNKTAVGNAMKPYVERQTFVPDSLLLQIIRERLSQLDCVTKGWILIGFPRTREQAESLARSGFQPTRVFFLDIPIDIAIERLTNRQLDPITGERYHSQDNPPSTQQTKSRLIKHHQDDEEIVRKRYQAYTIYFDELQELYSDALHISADQDPYTVFEAVEAGIVNPVSKDGNY